MPNLHVAQAKHGVAPSEIGFRLKGPEVWGFQFFGTNLPLTLPENMVGGSCNDGMMVSQASHVINAPQKNGAASRRNAYRGS